MKNLRKVLVFVLFAFATVFAFGMKNVKAAEAEESVDFAAQGYANQQAVSSYEGTNFTIAFDKGTNSNAPKYYTSGTALRIYGGGTITVSSSHTIVSIALTYLLNKAENVMTTNVGTFTDTAVTTEQTNTWTGSSNSVIFSVGHTSGHVKLKKVTVVVSVVEGATVLDAPTNVVLNENDLSWDAVENASGYKVVLGNTVVAENLTTNALDLTTVLSKISYGTYAISVYALGDGSATLDSSAATCATDYLYKYTFKYETKFEYMNYDELAPLAPAGNAESTEEYVAKLYVSKVTNTTYGNCSVIDENGDEFIIWGLYDYLGTTKYNALDASVKPVAGDEIVVKGIIQDYNGTFELKNAKVLQLNGKVLLTAGFTALETKTSLKLTIENEEVSAVAIRFGMMMTVAEYEALVANGATFGVAVVKKATLGENDLAEVADEYAFACATVVRVNANGEADEAGEYYQFAFVVNNVPSTDYAVELVAACYVVVNGEYFVAAEAVQSVQSVAQAYVNADDTSAYANYLAYLNELAGN